MINPKYNLTIKHDDNGSFEDYTREGADYSRDSFSMDIVSAEDYIYVGYDKPINSYYAEFSLSGASNDMTGEYYNGSAWTALRGYYDDTRGCSRSGFVQWDRNQVDQASNEVDSVTKYWYRFKPSVDVSLTLRGLNIVFCDLNDLKNEFEEIDDNEFLPASGTYINTFVNARNNIMNMFRSKGYNKINSSTGEEQLGPWDILDIHEIRLAASYYSLFKIFFSFSDAPEDIWAEKAMFYQAEYTKSVDRAGYSLDTNDNGLEDPSEKLVESKTRKFSR